MSMVALCRVKESPSMMLLLNGTTSGRSANKTVRTVSNITIGLSVGERDSEQRRNSDDY
jgi:hypothetical protein